MTWEKVFYNENTSGHDWCHRACGPSAFGEAPADTAGTDSTFGSSHDRNRTLGCEMVDETERTVNALTLCTNTSKNSSQIHHMQKYLSGSSSDGRVKPFILFR